MDERVKFILNDLGNSLQHWNPELRDEPSEFILFEKLLEFVVGQQFQLNLDQL